MKGLYEELIEKVDDIVYSGKFVELVDSITDSKGCSEVEARSLAVELIMKGVNRYNERYKELDLL